jgi:hypothetical protein
MIEIYDPLDPGSEYGLILYKYQRTQAIIHNILTEHYYGSGSRIHELPELLELHKKQIDQFFEGKDHEELIKKYIELCSEDSLIHESMIDIGLNRRN